VPEWIVDLFARYGYTVVFVGVFLENSGLPVPGETALLAGAALAHYGRLSLWRVIITAIAAAILGDNLGFFAGRRLGRGLIVRHGWRVGLTEFRLHQFNRFFARHGAKTVFIARFITGLRVFCAVLAGASALGWPTFLFYNATGAVVWATVIGVVGFALGESWDRLERLVGRSGLIALVVVAAIGAIAVLRARRASEPEQINPES
jgi:membrane protein DedA with SNARE-associated domain